jgi:hypothetical protein
MLRNMEAIQVIEEILSKVFKWHRFPVSLKAEAVLLYFKGLSLAIWDLEGCGREVVFLHQAQNKEVPQEISLEC